MSLLAAKKGMVTAAAALFSGVAIEYENSPVTPAAGAKWIQIYSMITTPRADTLGAAGQDRVDCITQVTINYPLASGKGAADTDYETIRARFPGGTNVTQDGQVATVINCGMSTGTKSENWFKVHFSINWYAFLPR